MAHDPKQPFVIMSITREEIATTINELMEGEERFASVPTFAPDDERLTDGFCADFAEITADAHYDVDETHDAEHRRRVAFIEAWYLV